MARRLTFSRLRSAEQPLLFIAIAFIGGLLASSRFELAIKLWIYSTIFFLVSSALCLAFRAYGRLITALLWCGSLSLGGAFGRLASPEANSNSVRSLLDRGILQVEEPVELIGTLEAAPELAPDRIYLFLRVEKAAALGREYASAGVVQIAAPFDDYESRIEYDSLGLDYGVRLRALVQLRGRAGFRNPGAPDFGEIFETRGIDARGWVKSPLLIERLNGGEPNRALGRLYAIRARAISATLRLFKQPASGILAASLFGNRYFLSKNAAESFRIGGTFHLLVISGLHVAMIAIIAMRFSRLLSNSRIIRYLIVTGAMWAYGVMAGAQPAVMRSVVMLSIVLAGKTIFRSANSANPLAAAAIVMLAWNPRDIFNSGFQLSFLTVAIIVTLTGPLYSRMKAIGEWRPLAATPYPPRIPKLLKRFAEALFWNEIEFRKEIKESRIKYRLSKSPVARRLNKMRLQKAFAWTLTTIAVTIGIQIGLTPLMIAQFHRVSLVSPLANVIDGVAVFALMAAGAFSLAVYALNGEIGRILAHPVNYLGAFATKASEPLVSLKRASVRPPDLGEASWPAYGIYFLAVLILIVVINEWNPFESRDDKNSRIRKSIGKISASVAVSILAILNIVLIIHPFPHVYEKGRLSVAFLDVGQGDSMLISFPRGTLMLLDSGGAPARKIDRYESDEEEPFIEDGLGIAEAAVMPYLWRRGIKRLDWIAASHDDADHVEGFAEIVRNFEIGSALSSTKPGDSAGIFNRAVRSSNIPLRKIAAGDVFEIDGVRVEILWPAANAALSENNSSVVMKLLYGRKSFLLAGDIEQEAEAFLLSQGVDLKADVLKAAHHGSKTSSTTEFLTRSDPDHVIISVAAQSPYGHPHPEVVERIRRTGAKIWKTSDCGAITVSTGGGDLRVETFVKCEAGRQSGDNVSRSSRER